jgi:hypothetical protein
VASHLSTIGFRVADEQSWHDLVMHTVTQGEAFPFAGGRYVRWSPGAGAEMWAMIRDDGRIEGANPHFAGASRMAVAVTELLPDSRFEFDGTLHSWAEPASPGDPESGLFPFLADVPDFVAARERLRLPLPAGAVLQVAAFAHSLDWWPDDTSYEAAQRERWEGKPGFAAESFIPSGLFLPGGEPRDPVAEAIFTGHVEEAEVPRNPATEAPFHRLLVRTLGGTIDVVADPTIVNGEPVVGGVVQGSFWLSARLVETRSA